MLKMPAFGFSTDSIQIWTPSSTFELPCTPIQSTSSPFSELSLISTSALSIYTIPSQFSTVQQDQNLEMEKSFQMQNLMSWFWLEFKAVTSKAHEFSSGGNNTATNSTQWQSQQQARLSLWVFVSENTWEPQELCILNSQFPFEQPGNIDYPRNWQGPNECHALSIYFQNLHRIQQTMTTSPIRENTPWQRMWLPYPINWPRLFPSRSIWLISPHWMSWLSILR